MTREQLEHIIRAAASIAGDNELIIIGSQSILGAVPNAPAALLVSTEADVYPKNHVARWSLIDGSIGEGSPFHATFGYYAQGVDETTAVLPEKWRERLIAVNSAATHGATGWCLEPHDLCVAKLVAGRPKDLDFVRVALHSGIVSQKTIAERIAQTSLASALRPVVEGRLNSL